MSDAIQLVPSVPVVAKPPAVRPDQHVEPPKDSQSGNRTADNGNSGSHSDGQPARYLTISRNDTLGTFIYRSIEEESGDIVWQYPTESLLRMSQHMAEMEEQQAAHQIDHKA